jgi:hypothetical protein
MEISYVLNGLLRHSFSMVPIVSIVLLCLFTENISINQSIKPKTMSKQWLATANLKMRRTMVNFVFVLGLK